MSVAYHNASTECTSFVPPQNEGELRTPASDGFTIRAAHRADNGNVHWRLVWPDFAEFLGVPDSEIRKLEPYYRSGALAEAAASKGYDPSCVGALSAYVSKRTRALRSAAALGFDPIYLWPATASKWPKHYQRLAAPAETISNTAAPEPSWIDLVGATAVDGDQGDAESMPMDEAIASAESFIVAIDCLPVGKDIRTRLKGHVQSHIELLRRIGGDPA
jgi:hypothetical protein